MTLPTALPMPAGNPKKILLPHLVLTEVANEDDEGAIAVRVPATACHTETTYHVRPMLVGENGERRDGLPRWVKHQFNLFPVVLDSHGVPWAEAVVYVIFRLEEAPDPVMATYSGIAEDLAAYRAFLDEHNVDWTAFPPQKLFRPTYRFNGHLKLAVANDKLSVHTARRRMGTVIGFYRWLMTEGTLKPAHAPWKETDHYIDIRDGYGFGRSLKVTTTDVSIKVPRQDDPYEGAIDDGGKLRPLEPVEQEWLVKTLKALGNTEMTLIHLFSLLTGARIQTILTFRVRHALVELEDGQVELRLPVGPGTGIDTKNDKKMVLHIPAWFYQMLKTYALSERARHRRCRADGGDTEDQYLFLSVRGSPLYQSRSDTRKVNESNRLRHQKVGQGVRQFIAERVVPHLQANYKSNFSYQFHDMRASAGMNWTDAQLQLVAQGKITLMQAREFVRTRMGHESSATTDRYLNYRRNLKMLRHVAEQHESHLRGLCDSATNGEMSDG